MVGCYFDFGVQCRPILGCSAGRCKCHGTGVILSWRVKTAPHTSPSRVLTRSRTVLQYRSTMRGYAARDGLQLHCRLARPRPVVIIDGTLPDTRTAKCFPVGLNAFVTTSRLLVCADPNTAINLIATPPSIWGGATPIHPHRANRNLPWCCGCGQAIITLYTKPRETRKAPPSRAT